jgi:hypothetical protein
MKILQIGESENLACFCLGLEFVVLQFAQCLQFCVCKLVWQKILKVVVELQVSVLGMRCPEFTQDTLLATALPIH